MIFSLIPGGRGAVSVGAASIWDLEELGNSIEWQLWQH